MNNLYNKVCCLRCFGCRIIFLGRQLEQLIQQAKLFLLFWLSCYIFRTTTQTTCTTKNVVSVVLVVVFLLDDNRYNLYNIAGCSCCYGCRLQIIWLSYDIAHLSENVNFAAQNVKRPRPSNRSRKRAPRGQNRTSSPLFGRQIFLFGRQKILSPKQ